MKKIGSFKTRFHPQVIVFLTLVTLSFFILLLSTRDLMFQMQDASLSIFSGVRGRVDDVSSFVSQVFISVAELSRLREENADLVKRIASFEMLEWNAGETSRENERLRELLGFAETITFRHIPARLIGRDPDNLFSALVINKGRRAGVQRDMAVIAFQNGRQVLVGKVIHARAFESLVMPIYDRNFLIASRFAESRYEGIIEGLGSPEAPLRMRFIPRRAAGEVGLGGVVISSGMGRVYPAGLNIGLVSDILLREYETTMEAEIRPFIDFSLLEFVFVIEEIPPEENEDFDEGESDE